MKVFKNRVLSRSFGLKKDDVTERRKVHIKKLNYLYLKEILFR